MRNNLMKNVNVHHYKLLIAAACLVFSTAVYAKWSFGVMGDTQWTCAVTDATDPDNPNTVSVSIIKQLNAQFIAKGVKFVIQLGDLSDWGGGAGMQTRAAAAQELFAHSIGFFPLRGNHDPYDKYPTQPNAISPNWGTDNFRSAFPWTMDGQGLDHKFGAANFSSPTGVSMELNGLSYSFDYGSAGDNGRFVVVDVMGTPSRNSIYLGGVNFGYTVGDQQGWINERLEKTTRGTTHAFVFSHENLMNENHYDCFFAGYSDANPDMQNAFLASLQNNDVKYFIGAHDHLHNRSIISSPDALSKVENLIANPACPKFYPPMNPSMADWKGQKYRQTQLSQDLNRIGFYIYTIDGPLVTVNYYGDDVGNWKSDKNWPDGTGPLPNGITPAFNFVKMETWGYGLNGQKFLIPQGTSYAGVNDNFKGTNVRILSGQNGSVLKDNEGRALTKCVNTGWSENDGTLRSNILTIWGMPNFGTSDVTDVFALSMTYNSSTVGACALMTQKDGGTWVPAVSMNAGGAKKFVAGPFNPSYGLGTYGIDFATKTVWAVINHASNFAVQASVDGDQNGDGVVDNADVNIVIANRNKLASEAPLSDLDNDGKVTVLDARKCVLLRTVL